MIKGIILDFNRTLFDPENGQLNLGVISVLEELALDYKLCLISIKSNEDRREQISRLGLDRYFSYVLVIDRYKTEDDFQQCLNSMSLAAKEVAVVGDRVTEEIYVGNKMGMRTLWYRSGKFSNVLPVNDAQSPDYTITKLE